MNTQQKIPRAPIVSVLGHIDHGKSTLLDYIRKSNTAEKEAGGITQKISAYEVVLPREGGDKTITFLDTPGHEAFQKMRERGASAADIAILVVSAEDAVKKQTLEAFAAITAANVPFIVAISKIDKPHADLERVKLSLAENGIYLEGYGGQISYVPISSKTGAGIPELLDLILLTAEVAEISGDSSLPAHGFIIETSRDARKGVSATLIIKDGSLKIGEFIVSGESVTPVRAISNYLAKRIDTAGPSMPVVIAGWDIAPEVGQYFETCETKKEAEAKVVKKVLKNSQPAAPTVPATDSTGVEIPIAIIPIVLKADSKGSLEALEHELAKIRHERVRVRVISKSIGAINESDVKMVAGNKDAVILGFDIDIDPQAKSSAERLAIPIHIFDIIYKLAEWLDEYCKSHAPKMTVEEVAGEAKIMRFFSRAKDKQIIGGKVFKGTLSLGHRVKVMRKEVEIAEGVVRELQKQKEKTDEVNEGYEFGAMVECKIEIAPGDILKDIIVVEKL